MKEAYEAHKSKKREENEGKREEMKRAVDCDGNTVVGQSGWGTVTQDCMWTVVVLVGGYERRRAHLGEKRKRMKERINQAVRRSNEDVTNDKIKKEGSATSKMEMA